MEIFNIGTGELLLILLLALMVLGPRRIPEVARTLGRAMRELRAISDEFTRTLNREIELASREEQAKAKAKPEHAELPPLAGSPPAAVEALPSAAPVASPEDNGAADRVEG
jgi:sec-independent protein translocase protein TatB